MCYTVTDIQNTTTIHFNIQHVYTCKNVIFLSQLIDNFTTALHDSTEYNPHVHNHTNSNHKNNNIKKILHRTHKNEFKVSDMTFSSLLGIGYAAYRNRTRHTNKLNRLLTVSLYVRVCVCVYIMVLTKK